MTRKLFGTDGVRGAFGDVLTEDLARRLGFAAARHIADGHPRALIVRDTRESSPALERALASGISAEGGEVLLGGVLPTPAAPLLTLKYGFDMAVVVSASHNPFEDNGIKFFGGDGYKFSDRTELEIERELDALTPQADEDAGTVRELRAADEDYLRALQARFDGLSLDGVDVLLDCANGATSSVAPEIFRRLGATVTALSAEPDGRNINAGCGSTHIDVLAAQVSEGGHDIGFAFDGDGDRVLAADSEGSVVDGDELLAIAALHLRRRERLAGGGVVVTVMSNYGFHAAMEREGMPVAVTSVGDRYVLEELRSRGWMLGGEQSGHIIDMGFNRTGDGLASALLVLEALEGERLARRAVMQRLPQRLVNVRVRDRSAYADCVAAQDAVAKADAALAGRGRILVRPSGTEPLVRVMVEAPSDAEAESLSREVAAVIESQLA